MGSRTPAPSGLAGCASICRCKLHALAKIGAVVQALADPTGFGLLLAIEVGHDHVPRVQADGRDGVTGVAVVDDLQYPLKAGAVGGVMDEQKIFLYPVVGGLLLLVGHLHFQLAPVGRP